jgi:radical SAM superfamily enzyme YgiQ (UPF0313 family)
MPSRILLISANRCTTPDPVFPLGLAFLNAALRDAGHETIWLDRLANADQFAGTLKSCRPDFIGISLRNIDDVIIRKRETYFDELSSLCTQIRQHTPAPIILGGSGFSIFPERLLDLSGADYGIAGEGEPGMLALIAALEAKRDCSDVPGLVFRRDGKVVVNSPAPGSCARQLSSADRPGDIAAYYLTTSGMLNVQTQRGCAFRCCYCTYPLIEGRQHRRRPGEVVAAELEQLQQQGARYAFIVDSVFNSSPRHVTEICEAILRRGVKISWGCFLRPQHLNAEMIDLMARAGLTHIEFGSDSFCDEVLRAYHKDFTFDDIQRSSELAAARKIQYCHFLIAGGPGETVATLLKGFENSQQLPGAVIMAMVGMRIYPGTSLFDRAVNEGCIQRQDNLLAPAYYIAPGLTPDTVFAELQNFARQSPAWVVGDPLPGYVSLIQRLRQRGVAGPLWSYFSTLQRIWQPAAATTP